MIVYKFTKLRKWVQVLPDGRWRSVPFGHVAINLLNSMRSGSDYEIFKKMYANQISPYMMSGYSTEYGKKAAAEVADNLKNESKMKEMFEILKKCYECVDEDMDYLYDILPIIHKCRKNRKMALQNIYDNLYDLAFRFETMISPDVKKETVDSDFDSYRKIIFDYIHWEGVEVCKSEYTDGIEEFAEKYRIKKNTKIEYVADSEWLMFPLDFAELLFNQDINFIVKVCSHCGALYATSYPQTIFCDCCRSNKIPNTVRKNNKCRQLHKNIMDLINNCKANPKFISRYSGLIAPDNTPTYYFRTESNYYWCKCQGKKPKTEKMVFYEDITTEKEYYEWLQKIHEEIKTQK